MSSPSGDIYATQEQVLRVEECLLKQQAMLEKLEKNTNLFQLDCNTYINQLIEEACQQRGSRGSEYINITKFISRHVLSAISQLQEANQTMVLETIPVKRLQDLEKRVLTRPSSTEETQNLAVRLSTLETELKQLKIQPPVIHQTENANPNPNPELQTLKEHIEHLETRLLQEVQRAYKIVYKPGELGAPLTKLQFQVDSLQKEINQMKSVDGQTLAENLITTTAAVLRQDFQDHMATRASREDLEKFQSTIQRIEEFSRDVQTGFTAMKGQTIEVVQQMEHRFSEERWNKLETKIQKSVDGILSSQLHRMKNQFGIQESEISQALEMLRKDAEKLNKDIRTQYGPEMLQKHMIQLQDMLELNMKTKQTTFENEIQKRLRIIENQVQGFKDEMRSFLVEIKQQVEATNLDEHYSAFEERLQGQQAVFNDWKKALEISESKNKYILEDTKAYSVSLKHEITTIQQSIQGVHGELSELKKETKQALDSWMRERQEQIQGRLNSATLDIDSLRTSVLQIQDEIQRELLEQKQREKYLDYQKTLDEKLQTWIAEKDAVLFQRSLDVSQQIKQILQKAEDREKQLTALFSEKTMRDFVKECEHRLKLSQEDWNQRRMEEFSLRYSSVKNQLDINNSLSNTNYSTTKQLEIDIGKVFERFMNMEEQFQKITSKYSQETLEELVVQSESRIKQHQQDWTARRMGEILQKQQETRKLVEQLQELNKQAEEREKQVFERLSEEQMTKYLQIIESRLHLKQDDYLKKGFDVFKTKYVELQQSLRRGMDIIKQIDQKDNRISVTYATHMEVSKAQIYKLQDEIENLKERIQNYHIGGIKHEESKKSPWDSNKKHAKIYSSMTRCFYTALFGIPGQEMDTLAPVLQKIPGWDYICFTNQPISEELGWIIVQVPLEKSSPSLQAKFYKWNTHETLIDYDVVVWVDAYIAPNGTYSEVLKQWIVDMKQKEKYILHRPHEKRDCVYEECNAIVELKRDTAEHVDLVRNELQFRKVPEHAGLFDSNIMIRLHKYTDVQFISSEIYKQLEKTSYRDQIAIPLLYCMHSFKKYETQNLMRAFEKTGTHVRIDAE
jgi:hypothetical protein